MSKTIRGWNCDTETHEILNELNIPKNQFSKKMNTIIKEWYNSKKQPNEQLQIVRSQGRLTGIKI